MAEANIRYLQQHVIGLVIRKREEVCDGSVVRDAIKPLAIATLHPQVTLCFNAQLIPVFTSLVIQVFHALSFQSTAWVSAASTMHAAHAKPGEQHNTFLYI